MHLAASHHDLPTRAIRHRRVTWRRVLTALVLLAAMTTTSHRAEGQRVGRRGRPRVGGRGARNGRRRGGRIETALDLHGSFAHGTASGDGTWGGGGGVRLLFGRPVDAVRVALEPQVDWLGAPLGGGTRTAVAMDLTVQPGGWRVITPYAGVSGGANWSGGQLAEWDGTRFGADLLAGAQLRFGGSWLRAKVEERYGYVEGREHTLVTRVGVLLPL